MSISIDGFLREIHEMKDRIKALSIENSRLRDQAESDRVRIETLTARFVGLPTRELFQTLLNEKQSLEIQLASVTSHLNREQDNGYRHAIHCNELETKLLNIQVTANRQRANAQRRAQRQQKYIDGLRAANTTLQQTILKMLNANEKRSELLSQILESATGLDVKGSQDSARLKDPAVREALTNIITKDLKP